MFKKILEWNLIHLTPLIVIGLLACVLSLWCSTSTLQKNIGCCFNVLKKIQIKSWSWIRFCMLFSLYFFPSPSPAIPTTILIKTKPSNNVYTTKDLSLSLPPFWKKMIKNHDRVVTSLDLSKIKNKINKSMWYYIL